ncbi:hypothetical protein F511_27051 [Dorcoceras hygrometricum]|uniref:Splicing factor 3B subunit 1-like n=1 Tax=Dorcoceras hygrometricum TaxID=472368 RepID=A0A2Z7BB92_9LAMI|nr:hypothetical protein F511_27051 [Dorcoceras hygrometricum]
MCQLCAGMLGEVIGKEERYKRDEEDNERTVDRSKDKSKDKFKERSSDRKMKTSSNKRFSRKHDRKVLVAEESTKSWADSDSDTSSRSSSSSESEQEEVHCFMADQTDEDEVFDFSNVEFTHDDLVISLNDMVKEYRKLSHSFEEAKAENMSLKSSSAESSSDELEDTDIIKTELNNPVVIDLTNLDQQDQITSAPTAGEEASKNQSNIPVDDAQPSTGQPAGSNFQIVSSIPAEYPVARNYQVVDKPLLKSAAGVIFQSSTLAMAASFYSNAIHVDFDSVLAMDEPGMVSMFQALVASGLQGFLACSAVVYEEALVFFFANGRVRDGLVVSSVDGVIVEISEELFAETFELPVDGLGDLSEMPKDVIFDARSIVSLSGEPISLSERKNQMKFEFRLLVIICRIKMNWAKFLFSILKKMVTSGSKQAKGFAIQISLLLATIPSLELGESSEFPASKILSKKTVHRFVSINDRDGAEEVTGEAKKKVASKKRPAADVGAAVPKKKRTVKKKSVSSISSLELVSVAEKAIPIQQVAEPSAVKEPRCTSADDVDLIIQQVLVETREADAPADKAQTAVTEEKLWFDLPYDDLVKQWEAERPVVTASDTDEDIATIDVAPADGDQQVQESMAPISNDDMLSADERMSLEDILLTIPVDIPLPSSCMEITKITMGKSIKNPGVSKWAWFLNRLPRIPTEDKGKDILVEKDPVKGNPAKEHYSLICADIELLVNLRAQVIDEVAKFFHSFSLKKLALINFEEM